MKLKEMAFAKKTYGRDPETDSEIAGVYIRIYQRGKYKHSNIMFRIYPDSISIFHEGHSKQVIHKNKVSRKDWNELHDIANAHMKTYYK